MHSIKPLPPLRKASLMNEKPFFSEDGIRISKSEVVINNENVPVESLCSLSYKVVGPNKAVAGLFVLIGALLLLDGAILVIIGGFIVLLGGIAWNTAKVKYAHYQYNIW